MKISAIVAAYNEETTIEGVLSVLKQSDIIAEIIVVNDGSYDKTLDTINKFNPGINIISFVKNKGKGDAIIAGIKASSGDIIVLLDADLVGLQEKHLLTLIKPVANEQAGLTLGLLGSDIHRGTNLASRLFPAITGQRVFKKALIKGFILPKNCRFSIDLLLTKHCQKQKVAIAKVELKGVTQVTKEEKIGKFRGFFSRFGMYKDIARAYWLSWLN